MDLVTSGGTAGTATGIGTAGTGTGIMAGTTEMIIIGVGVTTITTTGNRSELQGGGSEVKQEAET